MRKLYRFRRCFYCGAQLSRRNHSVDHLRPLSRGGADNRKNKVDCCRICNRDKGCLTVEEFRVVMAYRGGYIRKVRMRFPGEMDGWDE